MKHLRRLPLLTALAALSSAFFSATAATAQTPPSRGQATPASALTAAPQGLPKVCIVVESSDSLINEFADRLKETISSSGALALASTTDSCGLQLHVPGNLLRFQTAGGVMVSTVVIVTSASGRYLSSSITACQAGHLKPCAVRAVAAAKLALLMRENGGT
jgi:hypothetical protein